MAAGGPPTTQWGGNPGHRPSALWLLWGERAGGLPVPVFLSSGAQVEGEGSSQWAAGPEHARLSFSERQ